MKLFSGAPFRIGPTIGRDISEREKDPEEGPPLGGAGSDSGGSPPLEGQDPKPLEKIIKLIPGEVILLYTTFRVKALESYHGTSETEAEPGWFFVFQALCVAILVTVRCLGSMDSDKPEQKAQVGGVLISCVSFVLWILALGDPVFGLPGDFAPEFIVQAGAFAWAIVVPPLYKGDKEEGD